MRRYRSVGMALGRETGTTLIAAAPRWHTMLLKYVLPLVAAGLMVFAGWSVFGKRCMKLMTMKILKIESSAKPS